MSAMPFPQLEPKLCANADCTQGPAGERKWFPPRSPWQKFCCTFCRNHVYHYAKIKPKRQAKSKATLEADALRAGEQTPTVEHPPESPTP
jgi:hypothetical protein